MYTCTFGIFFHVPLTTTCLIIQEVVIINKEQFDIHNEFIVPRAEVVTCILTIFSTLFVHTSKINTVFFFWFSSFVNSISLFLKTISYLYNVNCFYLYYLITSLSYILKVTYSA
jgi:hypothetical protein